MATRLRIAENVENAPVHAGKVDSTVTIGNRAVLGRITNNVRQQPPRAVKAKVTVHHGQDENADPAHKAGTKPENQTFNIFVDSNANPNPAGDDGSKTGGQQMEVEGMDDAAFNLACNSVPPPQDTALGGAAGSSSQVPLPAPGLVDINMSMENLQVDEPPKSNQTVGEEEAIEMVVPPVDAAPSSSSDVVLQPVHELYPHEHVSVIEDLDDSEYGEDIYTYLVNVETRHRPQKGFMGHQTELKLAMRTILVDWLMELGDEFEVCHEGLFLAVDILDRYLALVKVNRCHLQLVGAAAFFLASKYEEIYPPCVEDIAYMTDDTCTARQILRMERRIFVKLDHDLNSPSVGWFAQRLCKVTGSEENVQHLTMFFCYLSVLNVDNFLEYPQSLVAASAFCLARYSLGDITPWTRLCVVKTHYYLHELLPCIDELYAAYLESTSSQQQACQNKFGKAKFGMVSRIPPPNQLILM